MEEDRVVRSGDNDGEGHVLATPKSGRMPRSASVRDTLAADPPRLDLCFDLRQVLCKGKHSTSWKNRFTFEALARLVRFTPPSAKTVLPDLGATSSLLDLLRLRLRPLLLPGMLRPLSESEDVFMERITLCSHFFLSTFFRSTDKRGPSSSSGQSGSELSESGREDRFNDFFFFMLPDPAPAVPETLD